MNVTTELRSEPHDAALFEPGSTQAQGLKLGCIALFLGGIEQLNFSSTLFELLVHGTRECCCATIGEFTHGCSCACGRIFGLGNTATSNSIGLGAPIN